MFYPVWEGQKNDISSEIKIIFSVFEITAPFIMCLHSLKADIHSWSIVQWIFSSKFYFIYIYCG